MAWLRSCIPTAFSDRLAAVTVTAIPVSKNVVVEHGAKLGIDVEAVNRNPEIQGFHIVKRRWVVERSMCATWRSISIPGSAGNSEGSFWVK